MENLTICGKNAVYEAIRSKKSIEKLYLQYGKYFEPEFLNFLEENNIRFQWAKKNQLEKLTKTKKHQGVVAILSPIDYVPCEKLFNQTIKEKSFFVVLDGITEPQNLGTIARTTEIFKGTGLLLPTKSSAPINEVAVKSSAGAIFHLLISRVESLSEELKKFKKLGGKIYAIETGGKDIREIKFEKPAAFVLGSEGKGISKEVLSISDEVVTIPTFGKTPSLNVSVACGIVTFKLCIG